MKEMVRNCNHGGRWRPLLSLVLLLVCVQLARSAVVSVDLGSEWMKVAVVNLKPGQSPISIAINEMSKRKSPALVAFSNGDRLVSEEAAGILARYPERVYAGARDMVGKPVKAVQGLLKAQYLPYEVVEDPYGRASIRIHDASATYSGEELLAMLLTYVRDLAEAHAKGSIKDAVLSIPPYFGQAERQGVLDAARIAGLNVLSLIHEHSGAALQYAIDKDFSDQGRHVVLYDMGASSVYAALVHFTAYNGKERGKNVTFQQFQVKGVRWDATLGGQSMEMQLVDLFAAEFKKQSGLDVYKYPKGMAKLKKQVKRTKEILSANTEASISVEALIDDYDFRSTITRSKFEELCGDLWERALEPLKQVLAETGISLQQLHSVELIGGATRVPKLQAVLSEYVGKEVLARHLDADEAVALGAALQAANLSDGIKLNRKIGMLDGASYGIELQLDGASLDPADSYLLVARLKKLPSKLFRTIKDQKQDFKVTLQYDKNGDLPPHISSPLIAKFEISGVAEAAEKYLNKNLSAPIKSTLHFSLSRSGLVNLDRGETVVEIMEWVDVPILDSNLTALLSNITSNLTSEVHGSTANEVNGTSSDVADTQPVVKQKLRKRIFRIPLKIKDVTEGPAKPLSDKDISEGIRRLEKLNLLDAKKRQTAEAKNSLESYIYATKDQLDVLEDLDKVSTQEQRDCLGAKLSEAEDWLYTDGEDAAATDFQTRLETLKETGETIFFRFREFKALPSALTSARLYTEKVKQVLDGLKAEKPWISASSKDEVGKEVETVLHWLDEKEIELQKMSGGVELAVTSNEISARLKKINDEVTKLEKTPNPSPPKTTSAENSSAKTASSKEKVPDDNVEDEVIKQGPPVDQQDDISSSASHDEL